MLDIVQIYALSVMAACLVWASLGRRRQKQRFDNPFDGVAEDYLLIFPPEPAPARSRRTFLRR